MVVQLRKKALSFQTNELSYYRAVGLLGHCRTIVGLTCCRTTATLSDYCRTNELSNYRVVGLLGHCRTIKLPDYWVVGLVGHCRTIVGLTRRLTTELFDYWDAFLIV